MIYQGVVPYKYLCHDIFHVFVSKYSENKSRVCAFVHNWSLTVYSVTHSIPIPMQVLGTGWSVTHDSCTRESESEVTQSCPTLCDLMDCSLPGSSLHGIVQAKILEWIAISFSRGSSRPRDRPGSPAFQADALTSEPPGKSFLWAAREVLSYLK